MVFEFKIVSVGNAAACIISEAVCRYSGEISPISATIAFFIRSVFSLHVSGDSLTHHQEYNAVYGHR